MSAPRSQSPMPASSPAPRAWPDRVRRTIVAPGLHGLAPHAFYTAIGPFGAQNDHYLRDTRRSTPRSARAADRLPALAGACRCSLITLQFALHAINHLPTSARPTRMARLFDFFSLALRPSCWRAHRARRLANIDRSDGARSTQAKLRRPQRARRAARLRDARQGAAARDVEPAAGYAHARAAVGYGMLERATAAASRRRAPEGARRDEGGDAHQLRVLHRHRLADRPRAGISEEQLLALPRYRDSELFSDAREARARLRGRR